MKKRLLAIPLILFPLFVFAKISKHQFLTIVQGKYTNAQKCAAYFQIAQSYKSTNIDTAEYYERKGYEFCINNKYNEGIIWMDFLKLGITAQRGNYEIALKQLPKIFKVFEQRKDTIGLILAHNFNGTLLGKKGNFTECADHFLYALELSRKIKNTYFEGAGYLKLAVLNELTGNNDKALLYYDILLKRPANDSFLKMEKWTIFNNIGIINAKKGNLSKAAKLFLTVYDSTISADDHNEATLLSLTNLGHVFTLANKHDSAIYYLNNALKQTKHSKNPENYLKVISVMGYVLMKTKPDEAIAYIKDALKICDTLGVNPRQKADMLDLISEIYYNTGKYKESAEAMLELQNLNESIYNINIFKEVNNFQAIYELKESNAKILELTLAKENSQLHNKLALVVLAALIILVIVGLVYYVKMKRYATQLSANYAMLQNSDNIKDKLFSIIGHDLKGPVGNAPMILDMYLDTSLPEKERAQILDMLRNLLSGIYETLDKILVWGSSSIRGIHCEMVRFSPIHNIKSICKLTESSAFRKNIAIENQIQTCPDIFADPSHFDFVFRNLLNNAIKFTNPAGNIVITCNHKPDIGMVEFCVADNGIGIQTEEIDKLFSPAVISKYGTNNEKGTGIGLTLCKDYINENGGKIWATSEFGKGSSFYFSLRAA